VLLFFVDILSLIFELLSSLVHNLLQNYPGYNTSLPSLVSQCFTTQPMITDRLRVNEVGVKYYKYRSVSVVTYFYFK